MALPGNTGYTDPQTDVSAALPGATKAASQFTPEAALPAPTQAAPALEPDYVAPAGPAPSKAVDLSGLSGLRNTLQNFQSAPPVGSRVSYIPGTSTPADLPAQSAPVAQQPIAPQQMAPPSDESGAMLGVQGTPSYATVVDNKGRRHRYSKLQGQYIPVGAVPVTTSLSHRIAQAYTKTKR